MALNNVSLRKLLRILFMSDSQRRSAIRGDIREELAREELGGSTGGGDFYAPFWYDAKTHVFGRADLHDCVEERIAANPNRANLYPLLRDGFLLWWNERRRWTNEPFQPGAALRTRFEFSELNAVIKIDSILSVRDGRNEEHYAYPYFAPTPPLSDQAARLGLWLLGEALPFIDAHEIRILDVIRGRTFSIDRSPLHGDEEAIFRQRYAAILAERENLLQEYR